MRASCLSSGRLSGVSNTDELQLYSHRDMRYSTIAAHALRDIGYKMIGYHVIVVL